MPRRQNLSYYREYRTLEHIGFDFGVSEATASRVVREVEKVLIQSGKFSLPGKKALYANEGVALEYIVIDATECSVERPSAKPPLGKKATSLLQRQEKATQREDSSGD